MISALVQKLASALVIEKIVKVARTDERIKLIENLLVCNRLKKSLYNALCIPYHLGIRQIVYDNLLKSLVACKTKYVVEFSVNGLI
jgi:hypothetical protein